MAEMREVLGPFSDEEVNRSAWVLLAIARSDQTEGKVRQAEVWHTVGCSFYEELDRRRAEWEDVKASAMDGGNIGEIVDEGDDDAA